MREWGVALEGEEVCTKYGPELTFTDLRDLVGEFRRIKWEILAILTSYIERYDNYHTGSNVKQAVSPEQQEISKEFITILLGISKDGSKYGFLIARTNGDIIIIGVWPKSYAENIKKGERAFHETFTAMIENPENWERIDIITTEK